MPNYVATRITVNGDKKTIDQFIEFVKSDRNVFDFNKITPIPEELDVDNWLYWCLDPSNWNTKWNSLDAECCRVSDNCVIYNFSTAWNFCFPIIKKLSKMFPDAEIEFAYSDDDASYNCGKGKIKNDEYIEEFYPDGGSNEGYQLYIELHPGSEYELIYDPDLDTYRWFYDDNYET